jgi:hypothetical protein
MFGNHRDDGRNQHPNRYARIGEHPHGFEACPRRGGARLENALQVVVQGRMLNIT